MIALISCSKNKKVYPCAVREMYSESVLFKKTLKYCEQKPYENILVLSAKFGVLQLNQIIYPYNETLNKASKYEKLIWAEKVFQQLSELKFHEKEFDCYSGMNYIEPLSSKLNINNPLKGLAIGQRLQFLS